MSTCPTDEKLVLEFQGNLDTEKCDAIEMEVCYFSEDSDRPVEFNLSRVEFISSAFLRLCIHAGQKAGAGRFQIVGANPSIKRVFKIAGLDGMLQDD
jgi:anti-anti-sigma factor